MSWLPYRLIFYFVLFSLLSLSLPPSPLGDRAFVLPGADEPITVDVGSPSVLFDCPTEGNVPPITSYSWSFNGAQISHDGSKYIVHSNGSLAVNNIQLSDAGIYSCAPQNALGNFNSSSATLTVNGKRE